MLPPICLQGTFAAYAPCGPLFHGSLAVKASAFSFYYKKIRENENSPSHIDSASEKQFK
jgi:hypothetical protein